MNLTCRHGVNVSWKRKARSVHNSTKSQFYRKSHRFFLVTINVENVHNFSQSPLTMMNWMTVLLTSLLSHASYRILMKKWPRSRADAIHWKVPTSKNIYLAAKRQAIVQLEVPSQGNACKNLSIRLLHRYLYSLIIPLFQTRPAQN